MRVLLAEDDPLLGASVRRGLEQEGFAVDWVTDGAEADVAVLTHQYDVIALDLNLPTQSGEALLHRWRVHANRTPVVVLTARGFVTDRVRLLNMGADDYLVKPFDLLELCARLRAVGRRARRECDETLECGDVQLSCDTRTVTRAREPVELSRREFRVLEALLRNRNRVLTRDQLERSLYSWGEEVESNAVDVHVHHLRRKLGRHLIETVRGVGYRIRARARSEA
jgi:two-component system OmpR family response regulator/two-component system response regulator QseB